MITESFDAHSPEIVRAADTIREADKAVAARFPIRSFIMTFSGTLIELLRAEGLIEPLDESLSIGSAAFKSPIYRIKDSLIGVVLSGIGAPSAVAEIDYVCGKTWTTDAFYRETESNTARRVGEGCVCVEMECSALQAVCDFRGAALYQFVYAADSLHGTWNRRILGELEKDARLQYFGLAWEIVKALESEE